MAVNLSRLTRLIREMIVSADLRRKTEANQQSKRNDTTHGGTQNGLHKFRVPKSRQHQSLAENDPPRMAEKLDIPEIRWRGIRLSD